MKTARKVLLIIGLSIISISAIIVAVYLTFTRILLPLSELGGVADSPITFEEQFAIEYLCVFAEAYKNPHTIEIHKVWYDEYYSPGVGIGYDIAFNLSSENAVGGSVEGFIGTSIVIKGDESTVRDFDVIRQTMESYYRNLLVLGEDSTTSFNESELRAIRFGTELNAARIQELFYQYY